MKSVTSVKLAISATSAKTWSMKSMKLAKSRDRQSNLRVHSAGHACSTIPSSEKIVSTSNKPRKRGKYLGVSFLVGLYFINTNSHEMGLVAETYRALRK